RAGAIVMAWHLDRQTVSALALPEGKDDFVFLDDTLKGFGVRVRRSADGKLLKRYLINYRLNGKQKWATVGEAAVLTATQARDRAREMLASVTLGSDPAAEKQAARAASATTFKSVVERYLQAERQTWSASSVAVKELYLQRGDYFKPLH